MMRRAERPKPGSHMVHRSSKTVNDTRDGEPPAHCGQRPRGGALLKADHRERERESFSRRKRWGGHRSSHHCLFFVFHFLLESGKANRLRAAWAMDKKGTTVPNRLSRLQHQFKIGTQPAAGAARCRHRQGSKKKAGSRRFWPKKVYYGGSPGLESGEIFFETNSSLRPRSFSRTIPVRTPQSASRTEKSKVWMSQPRRADPRSYLKQNKNQHAHTAAATWLVKQHTGHRESSPASSLSVV